VAVGLYRFNRRRPRDDDQPLSVLLAGFRGGRGRARKARRGNLDAGAGASSRRNTPHEARYVCRDGFSNLIALFIIITTAATLNAHGITDIQTSSQAAEALRPIAGVFTFAVFAAGIIGTGMLAVPVLAGSAAYALGEAFGWSVGLARLPLDAKAFYGTVAVATLVGVFINFVDIDPIKALFWSAVINGVVSVPLMVVMMLMTMRPKAMGAFTLPRPLWVMGWLATATMAVSVTIMFATW
jgi:Mn2+/Fe2+ NRAMP family transporter